MSKVLKAKKDPIDKKVKLNMTFEEAMKKALSTPIKKSKVKTPDKETKKKS